MRWTLAGFILLASASAAPGQAEGRVESVGFDGYYRTNTWTAMRVALVPTTAQKENFRLLVIQEDLDRDPVAFTQTIPLTGSADGSRRPQKFWMYFVPQPSGLETGADRTELSRKLRVYLATPAGKRLAQLDTSNVRLSPLDTDNYERGQKFILVVRDSGHDARLGVYQKARGTTEDMLFHQLAPADLPDNMIGFQAVDTILWLNGDPRRLSSGSLSAMQDWVREGGRLVICQDPEKWQSFTTGAFGDAVPVSFPEDYGGVTMVDDKLGLRALRELAGTDAERISQLRPFRDIPQGEKGRGDPWASLLGRQFPLARAVVKKGAYVDVFADERRTIPYMVRWRYGFGCVTWVAQDLGHTSFRVEARDDLSWYGWTSVWDRVFDYRHDTVTPPMVELKVEGAEARYNNRYSETGGSADLSSATLRGMDLPTRGAALVTLAILFFIIYWALAGPGSYLALARRKLTALSWPAFAACAVAATGLTIVVVGLVLRGKPSVAHVSVIRMGAGENALVHAQFGCYIPRDGLQTLQLKGTDPRRQSHVIPYPMHRRFIGSGSEFLSSIEYEVAVPAMVRDATDAPPEASVPYRSTIKKFAGKWVGPVAGAITGQARLPAGTNIPEGTLTNQLGVALDEVYMVFRQDGGADRILYMPTWPDDKGQRFAAWSDAEVLNLSEVFRRATAAGPDRVPRREDRMRQWGLLQARFDDWASSRWFGGLRGTGHEGGMFTGDLDRAMLMLSLFDRIQPMAAEGERTRIELMRRAGRQFDASAALSAGCLLILSRSPDRAPLPQRLDVNDEQVRGEGVTYYQIVVPMDR